MVDTVEPVVARTALSASHRQLEVDAGAQLLNMVPTGFAVTAAAGLTVDIAAGRAFLAGALADRSVATLAVAVVASSTNHVFVYIDDILDDGVVYFHVDQDDTPPTQGPNTKLAEVTTDGSSVTGVTDKRRLVPELSGALTLGGDLIVNNALRSAQGTHLILTGLAGNIVAENLIRPNVDDALDLGLLAQRFRDIRLSRTLFIGDDAQLQQLTANRLDLLTGVDFNVVLGDILLAAGRLVDGVDVSDHSDRHDAGGADTLAIDAVPGSGSLRTLGNGAQQAAQGSAFADHDARHEPGGADPMAVDAAVGVGSLRTLGGGALQAAVGTHGHSGLTKEHFMATSEWEPFTGSNPFIATLGITRAWGFIDGSTNSLGCGFHVPRDWDGSSSIVVRIMWIVTATPAGVVQWRMDINPRADGENITIGSSLITLTPTTLAANVLSQDDFSFSSGIFADNDYVLLRLQRQGGAGPDTFTNTAYFFGAAVRYTAAI